ncbi:MAG: hypothetical protein M3367_12895 [Acidobacteriota bacterium]|nr:hypothetical protein [Acidobacteriota bacterium]
MPEKTNQEASASSSGQSMSDALKSWMMVALTFIFVLLYAAALIGWLKPLTDPAMAIRLEPIIFVIIGYYFGRLPAQQNEKTLKNEINRQTQKADAAQQIKEQAVSQREALEEKVKNVKAALVARSPNVLSDITVGDDKNAMGTSKNGAAQHSIETAVKILDS